MLRERERKPPTHYEDAYAGIATGKYAALFVSEIKEPTTLEDAFNSGYADEWKKAADEGYQSIIENEI